MKDSDFTVMSGCARCKRTGYVPIFAGQLYRTQRERRHLSVRAIARRVGVSPAYVSDIELGRRQPGRDVRERLLRALRQQEAG